MKLFRTLVMVSSLISISAQTYDSENCLRALHDANRIFEARAFCDTFINAATATGAIQLPLKPALKTLGVVSVVLAVVSLHLLHLQLWYEEHPWQSSKFV
jgi:hypothetical protein